METEGQQKLVIENSKGFLKYAIVLIISALIIFGALFYYVHKMNVAAKNALNMLEQKAANYEPLNENGKKLTINDQELFRLYREKAYKESLIAQSKADSMGLIINLKDSSLTLAISGIPVFNSRVKGIKMPATLLNLSPKAYLYFFDKPFLVDSSKASFEKEPIVKREAPKDTLEAANFFIKPDTTLSYRVTSHYYLKPKIGLTIEQTLTDSIIDRRYILRNKLQHFADNFRAVVTGKLPEYNSDLVIYVSATDAMVIYRALPRKAYIVIYPY